MEIVYKTDIIPSVIELAELYDNAGLPRPTTDHMRMKKMIDNADLFVTAWHNDQLVGVSRSLSDFSWCCYLADLAIRKDFQRAGIGKKLIDLTKEKVSEQSMVLLLSVPDAMNYYPKVGMQKSDNAFIINRNN